MKEMPTHPIRNESDLDTFDPSVELALVRRLPSSERHAALLRWKERFYKQKAGLALTYVSAKKMILDNPDISASALARALIREGKGFGMSHSQQRIAAAMAKKYEQVHRDLISVREHFSDAAILDMIAPGARMKGDVRMISTPVTLAIYCGRDDAATLTESRWFRWTGDGFASTLGFKFGKSSRRVGYLIIPTDESPLHKLIGWDGIEQETVFRHEEQHVIERQFGDLMRSRAANAPLEAYLRGLALPEGALAFYERYGVSVKQNDPLARAERLIEKAETRDEKREIVRRYIRQYIDEQIDNAARDELLARVLGDYPEPGSEDLGWFIKALRFTVVALVQRLDPDVYDFAGQYGRMRPPSLPGQNQVGDTETLAEFGDAELRELSRSREAAGLSAIETLRKAGVPDEVICALLMPEPLSKWPKVVKRMTEWVDRLERDDAVLEAAKAEIES